MNRDVVEQKVEAEFSTLLKIDHVDLSTHFFDEGGQSISAVRLASRLTEEANVLVSVVDIFDHPTAGELVEAVLAKQAATAAA